MTINNFLKQFKTSTDVKKTCEKRIKTNYIPHEDKVRECFLITVLTSYAKKKDANGNDYEFYMSNTPKRMVLFNMKLISLYTDIEIDFEKLNESYDQLEKEDAIMPLLEAIPQKEFERFKNILNFTLNDFYENNRSVAGYLDHNSRAFFNLLEGLIPTEASAASKE